MTPPAMQSETPRTDHYRTEFKRCKETSDLIEWLLDECAQQERRLREAEAQLEHINRHRDPKECEEIEADRDALVEAAERRTQREGWVMVRVTNLLALRDCLTILNPDVEEAYHQLYTCVDWQDPYKPWAEWEAMLSVARKESDDKG